MFFGNSSNHITNWRTFAKEVRGCQEKLLVRLDDFPDSILVTGCQRSGGTMLARVIGGSEGMAKYCVSNDDELDAALILSGRVPHNPSGRYCFQTTYLNERYSEYFEHPAHYIIWSLRNPHSVVYSMVYNWKRFALNELFLQCGYGLMNFRDKVRFQRFGILGVPPVRRAVYAYLGKVAQVFQLKEYYPPDRLIILDYDDLVREKARLLPMLYESIRLPYNPDFAGPISERSLEKKNCLKKEEIELVNDICFPMYKSAISLRNLV